MKEFVHISSCFGTLKRQKEKDTDTVDSGHLELIQQADDPAAVGMSAGRAAGLRGEERSKAGEAEGQSRKKMFLFSSGVIKKQTAD